MEKIALVSTVDYNWPFVQNCLSLYGLMITEVNEADVILAIGGDSAVLKASRYNLPILAWNRGTLGFLTTGIDLNNIIKSYVDNDVYIEKRDRLSISIDGKKYLALNEIAVVGEETGRLVKTDLFVDERKITTYKGDGLLIATPTGSTAWNLSAGGSLVESGIRCMLITPMNPFTMNVRPLIIMPSHKITLLNVDKVVIDGYDIVLPSTKFVDITYSHDPVTIFRLWEEPFFDAIITKLGWNENIKKG